MGEKLIAKDRRIYVATYPTMLNIIRDESQQLSPHFFDLIVIDESHRSIYNTYGEILDYFKAITLGLTATPTGIIDHNTFQLFHCEDGLPTFAYSHLCGVFERGSTPVEVPEMQTAARQIIERLKADKEQYSALLISIGETAETEAQA